MSENSQPTQDGGIILLIEEKFQKSKEPVKIAENYIFDHHKTVNKIELYRASQFYGGDKNKDGSKKFFFNIILPSCWAATKNIDIDTKDVLVQATGPNAHEKVVQAMVYRERLKKKLDDLNMGELFNKIVERLPVYGKIVLKKVGNEIHFVPLKDLYVDPGTERIKDSPYIIEHHKYQPDNLKEYNWDKQAVQEVTNAFLSSKDRFISCYEFHGYVPNRELEKKFWDAGADETGFTKMEIIAALGINQEIDGEVQSFNRVLKKKKEKNSLYKDVGYLDVDGRFLQLGLVELGFNFQERWNQMANQKAKAMALGSKQLFQSRDNLVQNNLLNDTDNGEILKVRSEINPINVGIQNLGAYGQDEGNVLGIFRNLANSQEIITGESLPSGTPFRLGAMMNTNAGKLYEFVREKLGLFLEEVITEWILPDIEDELKSPGVLELFDPDVLQLIVDKDKNRRVNEAIKKFVITYNAWPSTEAIQELEEIITSQYDKVNFAEISEGFLDFEKSIKVNITGEHTNVTQRLESLNNMMLLLAQNPGILQDPRTQKLFMEAADLTGISPATVGEISKAKTDQPALNQLQNANTPGQQEQVPAA